MKNTCLALLLLLISGTALSQNITRIFPQDTLPLNYYYWSQPVDIKPAGNNGYLLGYTFLKPAFDYWEVQNIVIKTDSLFHPQWKRNIASNNLACFANGTMLYFGSWLTFDTPACITSSLDYEQIGPDGHLNWVKRICTDYSMQQTSITTLGHKVRMSGLSYTFFHQFIIDIDSAGNLLSADTLSIADTAMYLSPTGFADEGGNYYMIVNNFSGSSPGAVLKMRPDKTIAWSHKINMEDEGQFEITAMTALPNGDVVFAGNYRVYASAGVIKMFLMKVSADGTLLWQKVADKPSSVSAIQAVGYDLVISAAGTSMLSGNFHTDQPLIKTDSGANVLWARNLQPDPVAWPFYTGLSRPYIKSTNQWYFTSTTRYPGGAVLFGTDSTGTGRCAATPDTISFQDSALIAVTPVVVTTGPITVSVEYHDAADTGLYSQSYIDSCGYMDPDEIEPVAIKDKAVLYPNPADDVVHLLHTGTLTGAELYDISGKIIMKLTAPVTDINLHDIANGTYILRILSAKGSPQFSKLVVLH